MSNLESKQKSLELLAPAGDWDSLLAALAAGADAVYLGGELFNARQNAANFDLEHLREATNLLHFHGKKIYITVNTLVAEAELPEALKYLSQLYNLGVDAIIIQDLGLIHLARKYIPDLELHASTQMTVHNREGAIFLKELGLKRVVLAREMTKIEVESIVRESNIEIEVFIHGALCVCYSGQCLMSSLIGGRSGNRGRCAQPCRMEYQLGFKEEQLIQTSGSYLLSPKDIALIHDIPELHRVGVTSLKIEGRMKRPEYVYQVVKIYRQVLDRYEGDPSTFTITSSEIQDLGQSFNRGFSSGYFGGNRNADIMGFSRPNNRGVYLGRISASDAPGRHISIKLEADLETGDEIEVWVSQGGRAAGTVRELILNQQMINTAKTGDNVTIAITGKFHPGDRVFKIFAIKNDRETKQALDRENPSLKIACTAGVSGDLGTPLHVSYSDPEGHIGAADTEIVLQTARTRPLTEETIREQLSRLGNTPYCLQNLQIQISNNVMVPLSELNQVRRHAVDQLMADTLKPYQRKAIYLDNPKIFNSSPKSLTKRNSIQRHLSVWVADYESVIIAAKTGADLIYAGGDELTGFQWTEKALADAIEAAHRGGARLVIGLPRINREGQHQQWDTYLQMIKHLPSDGIIVSELGTLQRVLHTTEHPVYLNYTFNFFNSYALTFLENPRIAQITLSPELTLEQIREIRQEQPEIRIECLVQGPLELMVSEYCPLHSTLAIKGDSVCPKLCLHNQYFLRDRLQLDFPIYTDQYCRMHLLNAKDLCLYGDLDKLSAMGDMVYRLELKTLSAGRVAPFVQEYHKALKTIGSGQRLDDEESVIQKFKSLTGRGITKGHYFRGVE
jgi:U32 family peptidase